MDSIPALSHLLYASLILLLAVGVLEVIVFALWTYHASAFYLPTIAIATASLGYYFYPNEYLPSWLCAVGGIAAASFFKFYVKGVGRFPALMIAPALVSVGVVVIFPFFFELRLAFANLNMYSMNAWNETGQLGWVGFDNFIAVFTSSPLQTATFFQLLLRTLAWTATNVVFHVGFGLGLALLLNRNIRFKGWYRTILIIPWAMPQVVAVLAWRGEFHPKFGFVNQVLALFSIPEIGWWSDPLPVFISCCIVNIWLGIPFMMIVFLGGLQAIPKSCYEAAAIDGASKWQQFTQVTLPLLKPTVIPSVTLGTIWTFNNVNVIYLMTGQDGGNEFADILVTALFKSAFTHSRYSFSAAFALVICAILVLITLGWIKLSKANEVIAS